jgi:hypothetical protein
MKYVLTLALLVLVFSASGFAQTPSAPGDSLVADSMILTPPAPVANLEVVDKPNDHGHATLLTWDLSPDDMSLEGGSKLVVGYEVFHWVPDFANRISTLRSEFNQLQGGAYPIQRDLPDAEAALEQVQSGITDLGALSLVPALPEDTAFVPTVGYLEQALRDTIAAMNAPQSDMDELRRSTREAYLAAIEQLPAEYAKYPEGGDWVNLGKVAAGGTAYEHTGAKDAFSGDYLPDYTDLYYRVDAVGLDPDYRAESDPYGPVQSKGQWYNTGRTTVLVSVAIFTLFTIMFVSQARKGKKLYVRPLAGIEAVDDAIGRATEMGKPILYVLGLGAASDIATIASFTILTRVAKRVAEYQTQLIVPTYDPIVMTIAQEVVKSAYMDAGRADDFNQDIVYFVTQSQFAYVAAVNGTMLRELPATNVYMGKFYAESLILAETGALAGSIQIAGTDEIAQIPFFVVACDYTLIGEELYAASAYLGGEPILLGSLKAQDYAKALFVICAIVGFVTLIGYSATGSESWLWFKDLFHVAD